MTVMLFVLAPLVWIALSIPAGLILRRRPAATGRSWEARGRDASAIAAWASPASEPAEQRQPAETT